MKPKQRFLTALRCGIPDRVPVFDFLFSPRLQKQLLGYTTELFDGASQIKLATMLGLDAQCIPINGFPGFEEVPHPHRMHYQDEWRVTYVKEGWPIMVQVDVPIKSRLDWKNYRLPDPRAGNRAKMIKDAVNSNEGGIAIIACFLGPFTMMYWYFMDLSTLSLTIYDDPSLITEMCDAFTHWSLQAMEAVWQVGGVDAFCLSDDWGGTSGLLMSPEHLRRFFLNPFRDIVQGMQAYGLPVMMHNDGNLWAVMDDLVGTGINGFHPVERAAGMDLKKIKERYRGRLCPIGNINNKTTMVTGTADDVKREALECLKIAAPGGGYVLATDHSLHDDIPLENIHAYIEVARKYGSYPIKIET
jgi:uroporphyrinogen decarboxylase